MNSGALSTPKEHWVKNENCLICDTKKPKRENTTWSSWGNGLGNEFQQICHQQISAGTFYRKMGTLKSFSMLDSFRKIKCDKKTWKQKESYSSRILLFLNFKGDHVALRSNAVWNNVGLHSTSLVVTCFNIFLVLSPINICVKTLV